MLNVAKQRQNKKVHTLDEVEEDDEFIVDMVQACTTEKDEWIVPIEVTGAMLLKTETDPAQEPVLKFYDPEKSTRISADTSQYGLGAVLLQQHDKQWLPVAYASRALTSAQSRHGVPCEPFSDNGPQFSSCEFADFAKEWGFRHFTSSPNYPKSNGLAESPFKTVKTLMKKAKYRDDFQKDVLIYRSAPLQNGLSPAQMLMGRHIRSNLQVNEDLLMPKNAHKVREGKEGTKVTQKRLYDRTAKHRPSLKPGTMVHLRDVSTGTWRQQGQVEEEVTPRFYKIQTENGVSLRRNRTDLQLQPKGKDTAGHEKVQQDLTASIEPTMNGHGHTECGLTAGSASPADVRLSEFPKLWKDCLDLRDMFGHLRGSLRVAKKS
ncbi:hypothetical protein Q8A73_022294 [Channa argus]|nr:hypothetical protein Q8A73_022294 [Channa argus]